MLINWILEGLELHLEGIWDALGRSWASSWRSWTPLGCLPWKPPLFDLRTLGFIDAWLKKVV